MKKLAILLVVLAALVAPLAASAHPLGNFTVNRYSDVEISGNRIYVLYVLDMAEIPTFQARQTGVDPAVYARRIARNAHLTVDGRAVALTPVKHAIAFPKGQGGLHTMRLEVVLRGPKLGDASSIAYRDANYGDRIGWKEIVVEGAAGASVTSILGAVAIAERRVARVPEGPAPQPARRHLGDRDGQPRRRGGARAAAHRRLRSAGSGPGRRLGLLEPRRTREALDGRGPPLAADRGLLGRRPRSDTRPRQGARRRLPRRHEGHATSCRPARSDGDDHPHGRRLRPRPRHARALTLHRPRDALPVADAGVGAPRRRRRRCGATGAAPERAAGDTATAMARTAITIITTTTTITTTTHHHDARPRASARRKGADQSGHPRRRDRGRPPPRARRRSWCS